MESEGRITRTGYEYRLRTPPRESGRAPGAPGEMEPISEGEFSGDHLFALVRPVPHGGPNPWPDFQRRSDGPAERPAWNERGQHRRWGME
ncbi:hypothetical protein SBV1_1770009 [Verrucomicrobia bacterium]|nr:hypothetical protein SBV1_1770009 [Verrucomicrobiota bacterium]